MLHDKTNLDTDNYKVTSAGGKMTSSSSDVTVSSTSQQQQQYSIVPEDYNHDPRKLVLPRPGRNGAVDATYFKGKRFVLSGIFPEVGGGSGLSLGKAKLKNTIIEFGGRVTGAVSGKTDYLVTGKQPGMSKVLKARNSANCQIVDLKHLIDTLKGGKALSFAKPVLIEDFSSGYRNNGLARLYGPNDAEFHKAARGRGEKTNKNTTTTTSEEATESTTSTTSEEATASTTSTHKTKKKIRNVHVLPNQKRLLKNKKKHFQLHIINK